MASICISNYAHHDTPRIPPSPSYYNKWPESDAKLSKAAALTGEVRGGGRWQPPVVVDSVSCRQLYLRSAYTFSRKESVPEKTKKCFGMVRETVAAAAAGKEKPKSTVTGSRRKVRFPAVVKRVKKLYGSAISTLFQRV